MERVRIVEVGPRDGLQNEMQAIPTATKLDLIARLVAAGCRTIEVTAFVSPKWSPQMADHDAVLRGVTPHPRVAHPVLVPNLRGFEAALAAGAREVAVFAAASETFSQKNINCGVDESLARFAPVMEAARQAGVKVRGYVSCVLGCPYEGDIAPDAVARVAHALATMGCYEISLGDTIGVGVPNRVKALIACVAQTIPVQKLAGHFHDTYGMGAANAWAAYEAGVRVFDGSVAGLGGCPHAQGATGNVATEDLVWLFERSGIETGIDLKSLVECAVWISRALGRSPSRVSCALRVKAALHMRDEHTLAGDDESGGAQRQF
jgi:hydroxymethylglutaryl-CoA lyase